MIMVRVLKMNKSDIPVVVKLGDGCYEKRYHETADFLYESIQSYPSGCLVLKDKEKIVGYIVFHPYICNKIKKLNNPYKSSAKYDCIYIHDLSIMKEYRGRGLPKLFIKKVDALAKKLRVDAQALVAVQNSEKFWEKCGFKIAKRIIYFGKKASYMKKKILV